MEDFKISVLITFYNQEKYVDDCLESVFAQKTNFPFKVIVGDDGSTDGTLDKVRLWQEKYPERLSFIRMPREEGVKYIGGARASRNRLSLLKQVDTKYFHYLDGDDYWTDEQKLQIEYDILEDPENSDCVGCAHSISVFHENDSSKGRKCWGKDLEEGKYTLKKYWKDVYFHTDTILFRSENIPKLPYDLLTDSFNDNMITFCFLQFGKLFFLKRCMAAYRQNDNGIWAGEKETIGIIRELILYDIELKINPRIRASANRRHMRDFIYVHQNGEKFVNLTPYYEIAQKIDLSITKRVLEKKCVFIGNYILDGMIIWVLEKKHWACDVMKDILKK